jgi:APA family basic amino acid/polyamine antiporter
MTHQLKRTLTTTDAVAIFVGIILGSGVFVAPAQVVATAPVGWQAVALWLCGGVVAACGAFTYAECGARLPKNGGFYVYYREVYGEPLAFVGGWSAMFVTYPASTAAIALLGAQYAGAIIPGLSGRAPLVATAALILSATLNWIGVRTGASVQRVLTVFKVLAVLAVCGAALFAHPARELRPAPQLWSTPLLLTALVSILWSYDGWSDVSLVTGEMRNPQRDLGRAVGIGVVILFATYAAVQLSVMALLPAATAAASTSVLADAVEVALGTPARLLLAAIVVVSTFGSVNGIVLAASRLGHAMSDDKVIPPWFAHVSPTRHTPTRAIAAMAAVTIVYVWASDFRGLLEFFGQTIWVFYGLTAFGLLKLRRRGPAPPGAFRAPVWAPFVVIATALAMSIGLACAKPRRFVTGLALVTVSLPVYLVWRAVLRVRSAA